MIRLAVIALLGLFHVPPAQAEPSSHKVASVVGVPSGFKIELFAEVPNARSMVVVPELDAVLVGSRGPVVHAVIGLSKSLAERRVIRVLENRDVANGIDWKDGWLYVAEQPRVVRFRARSIDELRNAKPELLLADLPDDSWHGWRYARIGPDNWLYVTIGVPCNICGTAPNGIIGTLFRMRLQGGPPMVVARGVRNSVGLDFQPATGRLYFTDNGADNLGDDMPPDELNKGPNPEAMENDAFRPPWYGFPKYGGGRTRTPGFGNDRDPAAPRFPVIEFGAHVAALGISFYEGGQFPSEFKGDAFVAQHGSWNRTIPDGYRVMRIRFDKDSREAVAKEKFATGFLRPDGETWGRPVDVKEMPDGSLLVSDDFRGAIYRISYVGR